jgi:hypothetical protein
VPRPRTNVQHTCTYTHAHTHTPLHKRQPAQECRDPAHTYRAHMHARTQTQTRVPTDTNVSARARTHMHTHAQAHTRDKLRSHTQVCSDHACTTCRHVLWVHGQQTCTASTRRPTDSSSSQERALTIQGFASGISSPSALPPSRWRALPSRRHPALSWCECCPRPRILACQEGDRAFGRGSVRSHMRDRILLRWHLLRGGTAGMCMPRTRTAGTDQLQVIGADISIHGPAVGSALG